MAEPLRLLVEASVCVVVVSVPARTPGVVTHRAPLPAVVKPVPPSCWRMRGMRVSP
ncbi:hypothetical protein ACFQZ4_53585 [Catellatospora coxensis]